jgi:hypothetical protein
MSMQANYIIGRKLSKEEEKQIKELGLKIDLDAYKAESFKEEKKEIMEIAKEGGIAVPPYNPVSIETNQCVDIMGRTTFIRIGTPETHYSAGIPIPATEENREIVKEIEKIIFKK